MTSSPITIIRLAVAVLADRVMTLLSLAMGFGLYCWAAWDPIIERISVAIGFSILVFLPILFKERKNGQAASKQVDDSGV